MSIDAWQIAQQPDSTVKNRVEAILMAKGPMTLDQLVDDYRVYRKIFDWPTASEAGIRSRCADLAHAGRVEQIPGKTGVSRYGNAASLWRAKSV
jgi:hypothetical protein